MGSLAKRVGARQLGGRLRRGSLGPTRKGLQSNGGSLAMDAHESGTIPTRVLFVCLGNICRSPLAEGVFRDLVEQAGLSERFEIDSAGTGSWHVGEGPDARAAMVARQHGVELNGHARQVTPQDLYRFDYVIAMDRDNLRSLERMAGTSAAGAEIRLLREYDPENGGDQVPDPYYGGASGFETAFEIVSRCCHVLLARLRTT